MKDLKIGALTFKPMAIKLILLCLLVWLVSLFGIVLYHATTGKSVSVLITMPLVLLPYALLYKKIAKHVVEDTYESK